MTNPIPVQGLSEERLAEIGVWAAGEEIECAEDALPVSAQYYADVQTLVTELQHSRAAVADDPDEAYELGERDGYEEAIQELDVATGGDGEFKGSTFPGETVDVPVMRQRIIDRLAEKRPRETGWLIELRGLTPQWWSMTDTEGEGGYFTNDSLKALRFARKQDAEAYIDETGWTEAFASEHEWSDPKAEPTHDRS